MLRVWQFPRSDVSKVDDVDEYGRTAMWWACRYGRAPIVELLLFRYNANHAIADSAGRLAVDVALKHGHDRCAWLVLVSSRAVWFRYTNVVSLRPACICTATVLYEDTYTTTWASLTDAE